jgi:hypothetical protein
MRPFLYFCLIPVVLFLSGCNNTDASENMDSSIIDKTFDYFEWSDINEDSLLVEKDKIIRATLEKGYPEYKTVADWFSTKPKELLNSEGVFYKITKAIKQVGETVTIQSLKEKSERGTYMYFYSTEDDFLILELQVFEYQVNCINVRRIAVGYGKQAMHDILYNDKKEIVKEIFHNDVNPSMEEVDGALTFEFTAKLNGKKYTNTLYLADD